MEQGQVISGQILIQLVLITVSIVVVSMIVVAIALYLAWRMGAIRIYWEDILMAAIVTGLVTFIIAALALMSVYDALIKISAPKYAAIRELLESIGKV
jgi:hypothetical protein